MSIFNILCTHCPRSTQIPSLRSKPCSHPCLTYKICLFYFSKYKIKKQMCLQFRPQVTCLLEYQFNRSIVSNSLQSIGLEHARLPCPSPTPRACSNSCPSRVMSSNHLIFCRPLLLLPSIFPSVRVFSNELALHIKWPSIGASASASVLPMNI